MNKKIINKMERIGTLFSKKSLIIIMLLSIVVFSGCNAPLDYINNNNNNSLNNNMDNSSDFISIYEIKDQNAIKYFDKALNFDNNNDLNSSIYNYKKSLEYEKNPLTYNNLIGVYFGSKNPKYFNLIINYSNLVLNNDKYNKDININNNLNSILFITYYKSKNGNYMFKYLNKYILANNFTKDQINFYKSEAYYYSGNYEKSIQLCSKIVDNFSKDERLYNLCLDSLIDSYSKISDKKQAFKYLELKREFSDRLSILFSTIVIYNNLNDPENFNKYYDKYLKLDGLNKYNNKPKKWFEDLNSNNKRVGFSVFEVTSIVNFDNKINKLKDNISISLMLSPGSDEVKINKINLTLQILNKNYYFTKSLDNIIGKNKNNFVVIDVKGNASVSGIIHSEDVVKLVFQSPVDIKTNQKFMVLLGYNLNPNLLPLYLETPKIMDKEFVVLK